jgi:hypothetical protein
MSKRKRKDFSYDHNITEAVFIVSKGPHNSSVEERHNISLPTRAPPVRSSGLDDQHHLRDIPANVSDHVEDHDLGPGGLKLLSSAARRYDSSVSLCFCSFLTLSHACFQDYPLKAFLEAREVYGLEQMRLEGRGDARSGRCPTVGCLGAATMRCVSDCDTRRLYCEPCIVERHADIPLHFVEVRRLSSLCLRPDLSSAVDRRGTLRANKTVCMHASLGYSAWSRGRLSLPAHEPPRI